MFTFQKIPVEIHYKVLELLPKESIFECMLVSKHWSALAIPAYYNTMYLSGPNIEFLNSKLLLDDKYQDQQFTYGSLVKSLISPEFHCSVHPKFYHYNSEYEDIDDEEEEEDEYFLQTEQQQQQDDDTSTSDLDGESFALIPVFNSKNFLKLLSYMPNLKKLDLFTSAYYEFYMTILASQGNKYLRCIEDISIHAAYHELHFTVCYQFRHTLTHLEVYFATYCVNHLFGDPLYFLPHFKHLTNITLKNFERRDLTLFDILGICPHLTVLDFDSNFDVSDQIVNLSFKNMLVDNMIDIRPNVILHSHLQVLDLTLPKLSNGYIRYLTHYTDMKQLHTLSITLFDSHFDDWIKLNSVDTVTDFIGRLSKVTHLQFCTRFVSRDGSLDELVEANCFQEFLDAVQVSQPVYYETYSNQLTY